MTSPTQPMIPQMEYGQSYGAQLQAQPPMQQPPQPAVTQVPQAMPGVQQAASVKAPELQAAPTNPTAPVERDDLGIPAFLRRPAKK